MRHSDEHPQRRAARRACWWAVVVACGMLVVPSCRGARPPAEKDQTRAHITLRIPEMAETLGLF